MTHIHREVKGANNGTYRNPCITMHQPWASLLVYGIKRIEGRSWMAPIRGRLWIHAAGKVPENSTIKAMEDFYREIYAVDGITDLKFPEHYPVSRLLGCIEVVGCVRSEELECWKEVPEGVRLEGLTKFCWLCEQPQRLSDPLEMRGYQGVYDMERKIYEAAVRALVPVESPLPVKFPLPNPRDPFSLKPGSISAHFLDSKSSEVEKSSSLSAAIAGARAAATQFSKKDQKFQTNVIANRNNNDFRRMDQRKSKSLAEDNAAADKVGTKVWREKEQSGCSEYEGNRSNHKGYPHAELGRHPGASSKIFVAALRALGPS
ncbi:uncharacterized protein LOC132311723 [Cornus florida]|uniref:uncharacterized protein LOC132311723 n=1 Tax=Cornus florida TaxID=4283 RepID=UPI00289E6013|nr:uncharacterized protein LOC132311723 [Cornus florida]